MNQKNIVVIGLGGVGGYFGFKINQRNEAEKLNRVSFVARAKTYEAVKENGLTLLSPEHEISVTHPDAVYETISEISTPDLVLICVKEYDLENVCAQLSEVISENSILLPMMNGADVYDRIRKILPNNTILPSCLYVASHIKEKGIVEHHGKSGKLIFGKDPENSSTPVNWVVDLMETSGINFEFKEDALIDIWTKFIFIASFGLITAKHNSSIGAVCSVVFQKEEATKIMQEIKTIADHKGIEIDPEIIEITFKKAATFPFNNPTSLQLDVNSGKKDTELELFAGAIIDYGKQLNISTPYTEKVYQEIKSMQKMN